LNPVGPSRLKGPTTERLGSFRKVIHDSGIRALVRYSKAQDIAGACGQLVNP
jgi:adenine C2-methylase RlmN of 23S rRNA A2503 and tRNA A37